MGSRVMKVLLPGDGENTRGVRYGAASHWPCSGAPHIGPPQAGLSLALIRQASHWPCSGRLHIGFIKPDLCYWNISGRG